jgi:hypothetical protein
VAEDGTAEAFAGSASALLEVGEGAVAALTRDDEPALEALRLSAHEHNDVVWPELPASDPALNVPLDWVWGDIETRNRAALGLLRPLFRGHVVEVLGVECMGATQEFETFRVHTDCWVTLRDPEWGDARIQLFRDVLERGGGFKIFRYYDSQPEPAG